jgi:hypothetical protein
MMESLVHINWKGPFNLGEIAKMGDPRRDFGLYQVYAHHPVYGRTLVYIGKAREQTFSQRIAQHHWDSGSENDPNNIEIYVGRLMGATTPELARWRWEIDVAEKLLIHSHGPAYNALHVYQAPSAGECSDVRVLNWGSNRSLAREVSGLMWTKRGDTFREQATYTASQPVPLTRPSEHEEPPAVVA